MSGVYYCSPTNSTYFTRCCDVAICDDQQKCPQCKKDVYPFEEGMTNKERDKAAGGYYNHNTRIARMHNARANRRY